MKFDSIPSDGTEKLEFVDLDRVRGYIRSLQIPNVDKTIENITCVAVLMSALFYRQNHILDILYELNYNSGGYSEEISLLILSQTTIKDILRILAKYSNASPIPPSLNASSRSVRIIISNMEPLLQSLGVDNQSERRARLDPDALNLELRQLKDGVDDIRRRLIELYQQLVPGNEQVPSLHQLTDSFLDLFKHFGLEVNENDADVDISVCPVQESQSDNDVLLSNANAEIIADPERLNQDQLFDNHGIDTSNTSESDSLPTSSAPSQSPEVTDYIRRVNSQGAAIDDNTPNTYPDTTTIETNDSINNVEPLLPSEPAFTELYSRPSHSENENETMSNHIVTSADQIDPVQEDIVETDTNNDWNESNTSSVSVDTNEPNDDNDETDWEQYPNTPVSDYIEDEEVPEINDSSTAFDQLTSRKRTFDQTFTPLPQFEKPLKDPVRNAKGLKFPYAKYKWPRRRQPLVNPTKLFSQSPRCCQKIVRMYRDEIELNGLFIHDINRFLVQRNADYIEINRIFSMFMNSDSELTKIKAEVLNLNNKLKNHIEELETEKSTNLALKDEVVTKKNEIDKQQTALKELRTDFDELSQRKEALQSKNQGLVYINKQLVSDKSAAIDKNIKLTVNFDKQTATLKDVQHELKTATAELSKYQQQQTILDHLKAENAELVSKNAELKEELDTRVNEFDQLHKTHSMASTFPNKVISNSHNQILLQEKDLVIAKLSKDYNEKVREWNEQQNELVNCRSELNVQKETVKQISSRLDEHKNHQSILERRITDLNAEVGNLRSQISAREGQINRLTESIQSKDVEAANLYSEYQTLKSNLQETEKERLRLSGIAANYERDWSVWSQMDADYKYKIQTYEQHLCSLQQEHQTLKEHCNVVETGYKEAELRCIEAEKSRAEAEKKFDETKLVLKNLQETFNDLESEYRNANMKHNEVEKRCGELETRLKDAEKQYNEMLKRYNAMEIQCKNMQMEYFEAETQFKDMEKQRAETEAKYNNLHGHYNKVQNEYDEIKTKYSEVQTEFSKLQNVYTQQTEADRKANIELKSLQDEIKQQIQMLQTKETEISELSTSLTDIESKQRLLTASLDRAVEERGNASRGCQFMSTCIARLLTMMRYVELDPAINTHINELFSLFRNFDGDFDKDRIEMYLSSIMDHLNETDDSPSPDDIAERIDCLISKLSFPQSPYQTN